MTLEDIRERAEQKPFRQFSIETVGGSWVDVEKASDVLLPERRPDIAIIFAPDGKMLILGIDQISALEAK